MLQISYPCQEDLLAKKEPEGTEWQTGLMFNEIITVPPVEVLPLGGRTRGPQILEWWGWRTQISQVGQWEWW